MAQAVVPLPIEVVGENDTTASVTVEVPARRAREIRSLWMQVHGLAYPDMVSVQVNSGGWLSLNNGTVAVAEPGKSYGGIGGAFSTLKITLSLPSNAVVDGANTIRFRFNHSDGVVSGFRVLSFNFLAGDSSTVLAPGSFVQEDPDTWAPPLQDSDSIRAGKELWENAPLTAGGFKTSPLIHARCADCHAHDGRDLKYFCFSNASIIARSRFHGLSELQGQQIASYIRTLPVPSPGRPWNPPYQPGPGLDGQPVANWAAGAGLAWVLDDDSRTLPFILGANLEPAMRPPQAAFGKAIDWSSIVPRITREPFRPDGNLNVREIPISFQLPDWSHWLPQVHPVDAWGPAFERSDVSAWYASAGPDSAGAKAPSGASKPSLRNLLASPDLAASISSGRIVTYFDKWRDARRAFLKPFVEGKNVNWTRDLGVKAYSTQLWQLVKTWEMTQEFGLEARGRELFGPDGEPRTWFNTIPAATAPAAVNIPDGPSGMGGSGLTNEYFDASWYELQVILNSGNHRHRDRTPVDWVYVIGRFLDLYRETRMPEPSRLLVGVIKAMQSTDPRIGPGDRAQGWRPRQNVDPTIMVSEVWAPIFQPLPSNVRRVITESLLAAWLDKNQQYSLGQFFTPGLSEEGYAVPASLGGIAGGKAWEAAPLFRAAGVSPELVSRLQKWGTAYIDMAARFQYSDGSRRGKAAQKSEK
ncbi:MAG TPA: hypothetical protein VE959_09500 [Bryobacteraceae bacterium]|nr:hypothetical protein [Bryobacteraceae bacterium]